MYHTHMYKTEFYREGKFYIALIIQEESLPPNPRDTQIQSLQGLIHLFATYHP